jgi:hypothetical protein
VIGNVVRVMRIATEEVEGITPESRLRGTRKGGLKGRGQDLGRYHLSAALKSQRKWPKNDGQKLKSVRDSIHDSAAFRF